MFLSGSLLASAVLGISPFSEADVDLYIRCPTIIADFDDLINRLLDLTINILSPAGFTFLFGGPLLQIDEKESFGICLQYLRLRLDDHLQRVSTTQGKKHEYGFSDLILDVFSYTKTSKDGYVRKFFKTFSASCS